MVILKPLALGNWNNGSSAGGAYSNGNNNARSNSNNNIGFGVDSVEISQPSGC